MTTAAIPRPADDDLDAYAKRSAGEAVPVPLFVATTKELTKALWSARKRIRELEAQNAAFEQRLAKLEAPERADDEYATWKELEERGYLWDAGIWQRGMTYAKGAQVTYNGQPWNAQTQTDSQPGHDRTWRLAAKRGAR